MFGAAPSRKVRFDDTGQGPVLAELRLRGFDAPPAFDETSVETVEVETPDLTMSEDPSICLKRSDMWRSGQGAERRTSRVSRMCWRLAVTCFRTSAGFMQWVG